MYARVNTDGCIFACACVRALRACMYANVNAYENEREDERERMRK